jgi:hypothetical protein
MVRVCHQSGQPGGRGFRLAGLGVLQLPDAKPARTGAWDRVEEILAAWRQGETFAGLMARFGAAAGAVVMAHTTARQRKLRNARLGRRTKGRQL